MKPLVIARYSILMMVFSAATITVVFWFLCRSFLPPELFGALAVLLLGLGVYRRNAIWIMDGRLFHRDTPLQWTASCAIGDIEDVVLGEEHAQGGGFMWTRVTVIKFRGGGAHTVGQSPLMPSLRIVLARLRDALGLPKVTD